MVMVVGKIDATADALGDPSLMQHKRRIVSQAQIEQRGGTRHVQIQPVLGGRFDQALKKELKKKHAIPLLIIVGTFVANYFFDVNLMYAILVDAMLGFMLLRDEKYS